MSALSPSETMISPDEGKAEPKAKKARGEPWTSETARQAALRSAERKRERKAEREAQAGFDALTVHQRAAVVAAKVLTSQEQSQILRAHVEEAKKGKVQSARFVMDWLKLASTGAEGDEQQGVDWQAMTPGQRAVARAEIDRQLADLVAKDDETPA